MANPAAGLAAQVKLRIERARARFGWFDVAMSTVKRYSDDDCGSYAAALTYYLFFSIFPLLLFGASVLGFVLTDAMRRKILTAGFNSFPLLGSVLTDNTLTTLQSRAGTIAIVGMVLALYSGTGAVVALGHAINKVHHNPDEGNFLQKRVRAIPWLIALGLAGVVSVAVTSLANVLGPVGSALTALAGLGVDFGIFVAAFRFLPARPRPFRDLVPGATFATIGFEVLKAVGSWYLKQGAESREATFGVFASAAGLLVASYLLAQIILYAAELNAALAERRATRQLVSGQGGGDEPDH
jgi:membrane protein